MKKTYTISVTWGHSAFYYSNVPKLKWNGQFLIKNGDINYLDRINFKMVGWAQNDEEITRLYTKGDKILTKNDAIAWESAVKPGTGASLEGLRFEIDGNEDTIVTLDMVPIKIEFKLSELIESEKLTYHAGSKYSGSKVCVFMGKDTRTRVTRKAFLKSLTESGDMGYVIMPKDFKDAPQTSCHALHGAELAPFMEMNATFPIVNYSAFKKEMCTIKIQATELLGAYDTIENKENDYVNFELSVGDYKTVVSFLFSTRASMPMLEEIYVDIPFSALKENDNKIKITYTNGKRPIIFHRIYINKSSVSLKNRLAVMPSLPQKKKIHMGFETIMMDPATNDIDNFLEIIHDEELGDTIQFRQRSASASDECIRRWSEKIIKYDYICSSAHSTRKEASATFKKELGEHYLGEHAHEISNLAYGWGDADPIEERKNRTLPECKKSYIDRMNGNKIVGQATCQMALDYEAGVEIVTTELPGAHCSLLLSSSRGAAKAYDKNVWGCHVANHVQKAPVNDDYVRRLFAILSSSWLHGSTIMYDEEVAFRFNHDTLYSYSDEIPTKYREVYQTLYHYFNNIELGKETVKTGFLHGNYDLLVGGMVACFSFPKPKFWGFFGPESEGWDYDTPESGWKLIDSYLPGVHLFPIEQNPDDVRYFLSGTPYGQLDIIPINIKPEKLLEYDVLVLPGWNTMTQEIYKNLIEYVKNGGHLLLSAAQCTEHITRGFLVDKKDFNFINGGDLSELAGIKVSEVTAKVKIAKFEDMEISLGDGVQGINTELAGAKALAKDESGNPILVENKIGKGKVWMLTLGEYFGHDNLCNLRKEVCRRLAKQNPVPVRITDESKEVEYHCYEENDYRRIVLLNTDWSSSENVKNVIVHNESFDISTGVTEGKMKHILSKDGFNVAFEVPSSLVNDFKVTQNKVSFELCGVNDTNIELFTTKKIKSIKTDGAMYSQTDKNLTVSFGEKWSLCKVEIEIV